jgi:hypothetical protein
VESQDHQQIIIQQAHHALIFTASGEGPLLSPTQSIIQAKSRPSKEEVHENMNCFLSEVRDFPQFVDSSLLPYLKEKVNFFQGGQVSNILDAWKQLTSDKCILQTV